MTSVKEVDVRLSDSRTLHVYDTADSTFDDRVAVFWHHGTPNIGAPPAPLFAAAERLGVRWISFDRPGYGGSSPLPDRDVATAAALATAVADALEIHEFAVFGHSGGGPHALACAALTSSRVRGAVSIAGLAPFDADGLDWFAGMAPAGVASLRAAAAGRVAKERHEATATATDEDIGFTDRDVAMFDGEWSWVLDVVRPAMAAGPGGLIDDDLAYVHPWGFDPAGITTPVLFVHGGMDRVVPSAHGAWLAAHCPTGELRMSAEDGHISILRQAEAALEWLRAEI
jgi:pimeloyl-ACP methyl ester carboxylesterase